MHSTLEIGQPADASPDFVMAGLCELGRRWRFVATLTAAAGLVAYSLMSLVPPRYQANARILIESHEVNRSVAGGSIVDRRAIDGETVASQIQLLTSRDLARRVADKQRLERYAEFHTGLGSPLERILSSVGISRDPSRVSPEERVVDAFVDRLDVRRVEGSRVLNVAFTSADPALAADVANAIASEYIALNGEARRNAADKAGHTGANGHVGGASGAGPFEHPIANARMTSRASAPGAAISPRVVPSTFAAMLAGLLLTVAWLIGSKWLSGKALDSVAATPLKPMVLEPFSSSAGPIAGQAHRGPAHASNSGVRVLARRGVDLPAGGAIRSPSVRPADLVSVLIANGSIRVAIITACDPGAAPLVMDGLARAAASQGARAVIVEAAGPAGHTGPGLSDLMAGRAAFGEVIRRNRATRAHEIGIGSRPLEGGELEHDALETTLETLASTYDLVLLSLGLVEIGGGPGIGPARMRLLMATDHVVVVGEDESPHVQETRSWLRELGCGAVSVLPPFDGRGIAAA